MSSKLLQLLEKLTNPALIIVLAAALRLVPHAPNFAPISAMALFGGAYMGRPYAIALPLSAMVLSDIFIGFDGFASRASVYGSFIVIGLIGIWVKNHKTPTNIILAALASSVLFFIVTNFAVWAFGSLYPKNLSGLIEAYVLAIPFFRNTILGDLFYTGVFFGGYELALRLVRRPQLVLVSSKNI